MACWLAAFDACWPAACGMQPCGIHDSRVTLALSLRARTSPHTRQDPEPAVADRRGIGFGWLQNAWLLHARLNILTRGRAPGHQSQHRKPASRFTEHPGSQRPAALAAKISVSVSAYNCTLRDPPRPPRPCLAISLPRRQP
jgi:hypothetical protein